MITNITSLTGNGLKDWLIQRVTAVFLAVYGIILLGYILLHPHMDYVQWQTLFNCRLFQGASAIALLSITLHTWIGIWTVTTDYMKCTALRLSVQMLVALGLLSQFIWGLLIVWGR